MTESDLIVVVEIVVFVILFHRQDQTTYNCAKLRFKNMKYDLKHHIVEINGDVTDVGQTPEQGKIGQGYSVDGC